MVGRRRGPARVALRRGIARVAAAGGMVVLPPGVKIEIVEGTARCEFDATVQVPLATVLCL